MSLPTLYKRTSTGKIQTWEIAANPDGYLDAVIVTTYGLKDGKQQTAVDYISEGKNIGKANETTPQQQAETEAQSQWEKKVKKGYVESLDDAEQGKIDTNMITGGVEPMLAHSFDKQGHKISFPAYVQPKLDGHRCIAIVQDGKATLWSRTRKRINSMPHIEHQLSQMFANVNIVLDGELYNHDYRENFERLTSLIRQEKPTPGYEIVQYYIYDVVTEGESFEQRNRYMLEINALAAEYDARAILPLLTEKANDEEEMNNLFAVFLDYGFEGLMVRNYGGNYKYGRSYDLQKVKVMQDAEFEIIDITEGRGKMAGKAMFHCLVPCEQCKGVGDYPPRTRQVCSLCNRTRGKEFRVKMKGTLDSLSHYLDHKEDYIGKELTVKYQNLSADGIPRFPIGERIRQDV